MYSSDYPHRYDGGLDRLMELMTSEQQERVRWTNARELYRLDADA